MHPRPSTTPNLMPTCARARFLPAGLAKKRQRLPSHHFDQFVHASLREEAEKGGIAEMHLLDKFAKMMPRADNK